MAEAHKPWTEVGLFDLVKIASGQVDPRQPDYRTLPLIAPDHIAPRTGRLLKKESAAAQGAISGKYLVKPGDVIYSKIRPYLQKAYRCDFVALCSADMYPLTPRPGTDASFILHLLLGRDFTNYATSVSARSGIPKVNRAELADYRIPVPKYPEQRAIGIGLDAADDVIDALERLITKKQEIRQGIVQELLTGKTRLPGFSGSWARSTLGDLGVFLKGRGIRRDDVRSSGVPCIRYGEIYTDFNDYTSASKSYVSSEIAEGALPLESGDLLFAGSGETRDEIGKCVAYIGPTPAVAGGDVIVFRGDRHDPVFLALMCNTVQVSRQKARAGQGDAVVHIYSGALSAIELETPERAEQEAIARVVVDADREIAALSRRLEKANNVKRGMAQELLTGRTRLPVEGGVE